MYGYRTITLTMPLSINSVRCVCSQELQEVLEGFGLRANIEELTAVSHLVDIKQDGTIDYYGARLFTFFPRCCNYVFIL